MPTLVNSSQFTVHGKKSTVNRQQSTVNLFGFTLVELLLAIAILAIITAAVSSPLIGRQKQARDAKRKSDLTQVKKALESAKADCRGGAYYPFPAGLSEQIKFSVIALYLSNSNLKYLKTPVTDPRNIDPYRYRVTYSSPSTSSVCNSTGSPPVQNYSGAEVYVLRVELEVTNDPDIAKSYDTCLQKINTIGASNFNLPITGPGQYYYVCNS